MRGRPKPELMVSVEDREPLERWARRPKTNQALALRSRIVLRCSVQPDNGVVAGEPGGTRQTVGRSRNGSSHAVWTAFWTSRDPVHRERSGTRRSSASLR
jgi:hypothetical protein